MFPEEAIKLLNQLVAPHSEHLDALRAAKEALEKQIAKPHIGGRCPECGANIVGYQGIPCKYCDCGQKIDWRKE